MCVLFSCVTKGLNHGQYHKKLPPNNRIVATELTARLPGKQKRCEFPQTTSLTQVRVVVDPRDPSGLWDSKNPKGTHTPDLRNPSKPWNPTKSRFSKRSMLKYPEKSYGKVYKGEGNENINWNRLLHLSVIISVAPHSLQQRLCKFCNVARLHPIAWLQLP